ncbi:MAG TPA: phosphodiester glycosidase family protein [Polyangiaceae bacterium]|nr:phosphodiester glycosidase family protein [Polyangiaceae bacterium]
MRAISAALSSLVPPAHDALSAIGGWAGPIVPTRPASRWLLSLTLLGGISLCAAWLAMRHVPWFGPMMADELRSLVGSERVTKLEETVAGVEDRVQQVTSRGKARSLSEATPSELLVSVTPEATTVESKIPSAVGAMYPETASAEDGVWQAVNGRTGASGAIYRTIVHPDSERVYAELFVFALDLSKLSVHAVAGSVEPKSVALGTTPARPGVVPEADRAQLVASFNGGFKAEHGQFGMMVEGSELLAPKPQACTFAATSDGALRIAPWSALAGTSQLHWWRQTPGCMLQDGALHPGLRTQDSRSWGATLEGKTVIRRSAVGLSADARTLFVGISNSTTARALALGMQHVGARDVAQLDVNFSFPRFLLYTNGEDGNLKAVGAVRGLLYQPDEYLGHASTRDFFYVTARP